MAVQQAFEEGMQQVRAHKNAAMPGVDENAWDHIGRLTGREMDQVAEQALAEAILPNVAMLMVAPDQASSTKSNTFAYT